MLEIMDEMFHVHIENQKVVVVDVLPGYDWSSQRS